MTYIDRNFLRFIMHEVHGLEDLFSYSYYEEHDREGTELMLDAAMQLADTYLYPYFEEMDRQEPELEGGTITVHPKVRPMIDAMAEAGWIGAPAPFEWGGMQVPEMVYMASTLIFQAANNGAMGFTGLTTGSANLIKSFGSEDLKSRYLEKMYGGQYQGTMALTEPQAGSSLSDITSTASPLRDGSYSIKGQKIFISAGDHDQTENVVHLMLARIDGAPKGTKGISLFVVPKFRDQGGEMMSNDVQTIGIYHKMGQKATPTTHLLMGEKDDCRGWLLGKAHNGLGYMFQMMNEARILVGAIGAGIATAAYHASLTYAKERPQGRLLGNRDLSQDQTLIINHPDVQRMLLFQQSQVEASLSLLMECARLADLVKVTEGDEKEAHHLLLELLTPIAKTWPAEMGIRSVSEGMQVLGGGGFCKDFPLEQLYRDIRITTIYEGTTGIQSLDLLGRKVTIQNGKAVKLWMEKVSHDLAAARAHQELGKYCDRFEQELKGLQDVIQHLSKFAMEGDMERFLGDANLFMELYGIIAFAWQWLKMATAAKNMVNAGKEEEAYFAQKYRALKYFFHYEVPKTHALITRLKDPEVITFVRNEEKV